MRIFVYEHITGGGRASEALPLALLPEASLMLRALVSDLQAIANTEVVGMRDERVAPALGDWQQHVVSDRPTWEAGFSALMRNTEATWLIAPETRGVLEQLSARVVASGKVLLGSRPPAVAIAGSKLATARALSEAGVVVIPTWRPGDARIAGACVVKPDDGCGCGDTRRFPGVTAARGWIATQADPQRFVVQPYVTGDAMSLSVLAGTGRAELLSVNRQHIELRDDVFEFGGCVVNAVADADGKLARLAEQTLAAIPGLWGYVGIDVLLAPSGPIVVEVNPRLTTSYAGLHAAIGVNPAHLVLDLLGEQQRVRAPVPTARTVDVDLKAEPLTWDRA